jgi:hypothetical protein
LTWLKLGRSRHGSLVRLGLPDVPMPRFVLKAIFGLLTLDKTSRKRRDWDRIVLILSGAVTIGLVALYLYGKSTSRW